MATIDDDGVQVETLGERVDSLKADFLEAFPAEGDQALDLSPDSYTGREVVILGEQFVLSDQLLLHFVDLIDPTNATGVFVDFHLALQATRRKAATFSTIPATVYGLPGTVVGDKRVKYLPNNTLWRTPAGLTIGATGVTPTTLTAADSGAVSALNTGSASWTIVDITAGWDAVESSDSVRLGSAVESDGEGRARAARTAAGVGLGTKPALLKGLWEVNGVTDVGINNNRGLLPDSNGVPGKSVECIVDGGTDEDVATVIATVINGTAGYFGDTSVEVMRDIELEDGSTVLFVEDVRFTRTQQVPVIARYTIAFGVPANAPDDAEALAKAVGAAYINGAGRDVDVVPTASGAAVTNALPAASEPVVTTLVAYKGSALAGSTLAISSRQRATINPAAQPASVTSTNVEPFNFDVSWVLDLEVDGVGYPVAFASADFAVASAATALEIADVINTQVSALVASVDDGALLLETKTTGAAAELRITATTSALLLATLGLSVGTTNGSDGDIEVVIV